MDTVGESLEGQIPKPAPSSVPADRQPSAAPEGQVEAPAGEPAVYTGPERRAQGYLVAEILPGYPAVDGKAPAFDRPR